MARAWLYATRLLVGSLLGLALVTLASGISDATFLSIPPHATWGDRAAMYVGVAAITCAWLAILVVLSKLATYAWRGDPQWLVEFEPWTVGTAPTFVLKPNAPMGVQFLAANFSCAIKAPDDAVALVEHGNLTSSIAPPVLRCPYQVVPTPPGRYEVRWYRVPERGHVYEVANETFDI